jgi:hypothetical protein
MSVSHRYIDDESDIPILHSVTFRFSEESRWKTQAEIQMQPMLRKNLWIDILRAVFEEILQGRDSG